jgi:hypothetical protein
MKKTFGDDEVQVEVLLRGQPAGELVHPFEKIGMAVFIRTATYFQVGRVVGQAGNFVQLADAAYIPDTGRFSKALDSGEFDSVEPVGVPVWVNMLGVIDVYEWRHELPLARRPA